MDKVPGPGPASHPAVGPCLGHDFRWAGLHGYGLLASFLVTRTGVFPEAGLYGSWPSPAG